MRTNFFLSLSILALLGQISYSPSNRSIVGGSGTLASSTSGTAYRLAAAADTTGTSEEILASFSLPANAFDAIGSGFRIFVVAITAANVNAKSLRVRQGTTVAGAMIVGTITTSSSAATLYADTTCLRTATAGTIRCRDAVTGADRSVASLDFTAAMPFVISGLTPTAAADMSLVSANVQVF